MAETPKVEDRMPDAAPEPFDFDGMAAKYVMTLLTRHECEWPQLVEDMMRHLYAQGMLDAGGMMSDLVHEVLAEDARRITHPERRPVAQSRVAKLMAMPCTGRPS